MRFALLVIFILSAPYARACFPSECKNPLLHCVEETSEGRANPNSAYQLTIDRLGREYSAWFTVRESRISYLYQDNVYRSSADNGNIDIYTGQSHDGAAIDVRVDISGPADQVGGKYYYRADLGYESNSYGAFGMPVMCTYGYF